MLKVNEYFDGKVKSIGFEDGEGPVTSGVMESGDYTFSTSSKELMTVVTGALAIKRPGNSEWVTTWSSRRPTSAATAERLPTARSPTPVLRDQAMIYTQLRHCRMARRALRRAMPSVMN
jgi:uncharacterized protein YaiE (UPF0345 family)